MFVSRPASRPIISSPRRESPVMVSSNSMVSLQPVMAVRGVRSSWDTDETNSDWTFSASQIFSDMSLIASVSSPISSLLLFTACKP